MIEKIKDEEVLSMQNSLFYKILFSTFCFLMVLAGVVLGFVARTLLLQVLVSSGVGGEGAPGFGAETLEHPMISPWVVVLLLPLPFLSLFPVYIICMKLARYLREKRGWPIDRPRRLFAYSILALVGLTMLLVLAGVILGIPDRLFW